MQSMLFWCDRVEMNFFVLLRLILAMKSICEDVVQYVKNCDALGLISETCLKSFRLKHLRSLYRENITYTYLSYD